MPTSPYILGLREKVGHQRLLLPSVSVHIFDGARRLLLVRLRDHGQWSTPGGAIEPGRTPSRRRGPGSLGRNRPGGSAPSLVRRLRRTALRGAISQWG